MSRMLRIMAPILLLLLLFLPLAAVAEEPASQAPVLWPGSGEIPLRVQKLADEAGQDSQRLQQLQQLDELREALVPVRERLARLNERVAVLGAPEHWHASLLQEVRLRIRSEKLQVDEIQQQLAKRLERSEKIRHEWSKKKTFWQDWFAALRQEQAAFSPELEQQGKQQIEQLLKQERRTAALIVDLQQQVADFQGELVPRLAAIEGAPANIQRKTFSRTSHSLFSAAFYQQFDDRLWQQAKIGYAMAIDIADDFWERNSWLLAGQLLLLAMCFGFLRHHRKEIESTEEWQFVLDHPLATSLFLSVFLLGFFYQAAPALWTFSQLAIAVVSVTILAADLLRNRQQRVLVWSLAGLFVVSKGLQALALPLPWYRLYLLLVCVLALPWLLYLSSRYRKLAGRGGYTLLLLRLGTVIAATALLCQLAGYATLAFRLVESTNESVFVLLFAIMAKRLGDGLIEFALESDLIRQHSLISRFGSEISRRLKRILSLVLVVLALLLLIEVWGGTTSMGERWSMLLDLHVDIGGFTLSLELVLLALLTLYLSFEISWLLQILIDSKLLKQQMVDRGVRESIKKLLHYLLVLIGFLLAISVLGFELQHFLVLAGALGVGIGFGLQNIVNNFISGIILLFERPIKVGDIVMIGQDWGTVSNIGLRSTIVETWDRAEIIVPNSQLISEQVTNWTLNSNVSRVILAVGVAYGSDVARVLEILKEAADVHPKVLKEPPASALFRGFGESSLDFELRVWTDNVRERLSVQSELGQYVDQRFRQEKIEIPFPQRDLHLRSVDGTLLEKVSKKPGTEGVPGS